MILAELFEGGITGILKGAREIISSLKADPLEIAKLNAALAQAENAMNTALIQAQARINELESQSDDKFKSRWRPAIGWVCAFGLAYQIAFRPITQSIVMFWYPDYHMVALEIDTLMTLLFGMLGLGAYRTYEKVVK